MSELAPSLAAIQAAYAAANGGAPQAPAPAQSFAPPAPPAPPPPAAAPPQVPPGFYLASDNRLYPLAAQPQPAPAPQAPPVAPAPQPLPQPVAVAPAPAQAPLPTGFSVPPQQAQQLAAQHAQQTLPINPPEAQQALQPEVQAALPEPKKRGGGRKRTQPSANANATEGEELSFAEAYAQLAAFVPKGGSVTVQGELG
jgi:hypothetical protein